MTSLDEIAATIESLPALLGALLAPIHPAVLTTPPEPGEWSVHQVVGHLTTVDGPAFRDRIADNRHRRWPPRDRSVRARPACRVARLRQRSARCAACRTYC